VIPKAGEDLTENLEDAPHSEEFREKFLVIGILRND